MTLSRRRMLGLVGAGTLAGVAAATVPGCSLLGSGTPQPTLLPSTAPLPKAFSVPLPVPPVARPARTDPTTDYYELTQRPARSRILPGLETPIWGYDGRFPGPTIRASRGRRTVVRVVNELTVPTVTHLHGGRTPPDSDGYPTHLVEPRAAREYEFPLDQRAATLWYHDHRMDYTGHQVWRGLAGFFLVTDPEEDALGLPRGQRDIPLLICDRSFAEDGTMPYPGYPDRPGVREGYRGGLLGDVVLVNGAPWPELRVARARYRFRILNGSNARAYELGLSGERPFVRIASDGGLLTTPQRITSLRLAPAERAEIVVDFSDIRAGEGIELRNLIGEGSVARVMRFAVDGGKVRDDARVPSRLSRIEPLDPGRAAVTRDFDFTSGDLHGGVGWLINGKPFDTERIDASPRLGDVEIWRLRSDVAHPVHLHLAHFQVLSVDGGRVEGPPVWKDTVELRDNQIVEIITRFTGYRGRYVLHCHNLEHEDMMMMANFEVI
ncbi:MAG TPA: multicopper oxidase family protein [Actinopolymorphaceae bacterium]